MERTIAFPELYLKARLNSLDELLEQLMQHEFPLLLECADESIELLKGGYVDFLKGPSPSKSHIQDNELTVEEKVCDNIQSIINFVRDITNEIQHMGEILEEFGETKLQKCYSINTVRDNLKKNQADRIKYR